MMWIDDEPIEGDPNNSGTTETQSIFADSVQMQADYPGENPVSPYAGNVKTYTEAVDQTVGGKGLTANLLGWSDGVLSVAQRWAKLTGLVIMPPKTAELRASVPYGNIGRDNSAQNLLLGTDYQETTSLLPDAATIARSYTHGAK